VSTPRGRSALRRAGLFGVALVVALAAVVGLILFFNARDEAPVSSKEPRGPGQEFPDQGSRELRAGERPSVPYNSDPPTSGPHVRSLPRAQSSSLSNDQILTAAAAGNVVMLYGTPAPPPALRTLAAQVGEPFEPALLNAGQVVVLGRRAGTRGIVAVAWRRLLRAETPQDPALREFADFWLGRGTKG
jgi:uncharacterized protein DUF3105